MNRIEWLGHIRKEIFGGRDNLHIVEVGVLRGEYASEIVKTFPNSQIYLVDTWSAIGNDPYFAQNQPMLDAAHALVIEKFGKNPNVNILKMDSVTAARNFPDGFFDLGYIDANHARVAVEQDIRFWYPKIKIGGVAAGHDYDPDPVVQNSPRFGVNEAVKNMLGTDFQLTGEEYYKSWYHIKRA